MARTPREDMAMPASREPVSLMAVDRAASELRRARMVAIKGGGGRSFLVLAAEGATAAAIAEARQLSGGAARLALTGRRAAVLGLARDDGGIAVVGGRAGIGEDLVAAFADPLSDAAAGNLSTAGIEVDVRPAGAHDGETAAVLLAKLARLLPAAVLLPIESRDADDLEGWTRRLDIALVDAGDVFQYDATSARTLKRVSEARVPLAGAEDARVVAFRPLDGGLEHFAIVVGEPPAGRPVLARVHSECFTGDLLGSLRCDCGDQLQGAMAEIKAAGAGVLLYLAQEGRGIGLVNKLRAYTLQDRGFDTLDANEQLGYGADERVYLPAARMLQELGYREVRLMTNNPEKVSALEHFGVKVVERVPHTFPANEHNAGYLRTKAERSGHLF